jgi:hypothetical protein
MPILFSVKIKKKIHENYYGRISSKSIGSNVRKWAYVA